MIVRGTAKRIKPEREKSMPTRLGLLEIAIFFFLKQLVDGVQSKSRSK